MSPSPDPASFRDPSSTVFLSEGRVLRALGPDASADWERLQRAPFYAGAVAAGRIVPTRVADDVDPASLGGSWVSVLEHDRIPFLSFPYEWTFSMLRDAALLHLDLLIDALGAGMTMKDGYAYNVQFRGSVPTFIDVPSFTRDSGGPWAGYRQFCETLLYPLLLVAHRNIDHRPLLRGRLEGIRPHDMKGLLGATGLLKKGALRHVFLHAAVEQRFASSGARKVTSDLKGAGFSSEMTKAVAGSLRKLVAGLGWKQSDSAWSAYRETCSYSDADRGAKDAFVDSAVAAHPGSLTWDLGCNDGAYARIAARHTDTVVAIDSDPVVIDVLHRRLREEGNTKILPLVLDLSDPSPGLGWANRERPSFTDRARPDLVLALALVHHLAITASVPLPEIVDWFADLGATVVVEFVEPDDPMAAQMLAHKPAGRHDDYRREAFEKLLGERFDELGRQTLPSGRRTLYLLRPRGRST